MFNPVVRDKLSGLISFMYLRLNYLYSLKDKKIRVGFIVQLPEVWDKEEAVYEKMIQRNNFSVFLIVVPEFDRESMQIGGYDSLPQFFSKYNNVLYAVNEYGNWLNIRKYHFNYIFYQRPYDMYLPEHLRSNILARYTKICYIPYAFWPFKEVSIGYNAEFFRNVYLAFLDTQENAEYLKSQHSLSRKKNVQKFCYMGYPVFEKYLTMESDIAFLKILWTPRWTANDSVGGTNFFRYKDAFINLREIYPELEIVLRPHPLAFSEYISSGLISREDLESFKERLKKVNILIDSNSNINDTFKDTSVLIADISSVIIMFFLTGRPIIYCGSSAEICDTYKLLLPGLYIADTWADVKKHLRELSHGNDYLYHVRQQIINEYFCSVCEEDISGRIVNYIENDHYKR